MQQRLPVGQAIEAESSAGFWQIDADMPVVTVDDADSLRDAAVLLRAACAVGIDCEWQPGSSRPSATLLQLAVRTDTASCVVLILVRHTSASLRPPEPLIRSARRPRRMAVFCSLTAARMPFAGHAGAAGRGGGVRPTALPAG